MNLLLIDNYDSFTWNLHHLLQPLVSNIDVILNDHFDIHQIKHYNGVVFSPGPDFRKMQAACPK